MILSRGRHVGQSTSIELFFITVSADKSAKCSMIDSFLSLFFHATVKLKISVATSSKLVYYFTMTAIYHPFYHFRGGVGITGSRQTYFYAEITDAMKVSAGGGLVEDGEMIEVYELPLMSAHEFMWDESKEKPVGVILGLMWFFQNKRPALAPTAL